MRREQSKCRKEPCDAGAATALAGVAPCEWGAACLLVSGYETLVGTHHQGGPRSVGGQRPEDPRHPLLSCLSPFPQAFGGMMWAGVWVTASVPLTTRLTQASAQNCSW